MTEELSSVLSLFVCGSMGSSSRNRTEVKMKIRPPMIFAVVAAAAAGLGLWAWQFRDTTDNRNNAQMSPGVTLTNPKLVEAHLLEAGLPPELATLFSTVTTDVVSSGSGRAHLVHQIPALGLRQEVFIAIQPDHQLDIEGLRGLPIGAGTLVYPLHHSLREVPRGYERNVAAFLPYDSIDPSMLQQLGLQRRAERRREWNILPVAHAQSGLLGIVIASITTTTGSGLGATAPGAYEPGLDRTASPAAQPAAPAPEAPAPDGPVLRGGDPRFEGPQQWTDGSAGPSPRQVRDWADSRRNIGQQGTLPMVDDFLTPEQSAEMRRTGERFMAEQSRRVNAEYERIQRHFEEAGRREAAARRAQSQSGQGGACGAASSAASNAIPNLLQAIGAATAVAEARSQFQSTAADRATGNELIDAYERAFRGETGNPQVDALARRALTADPVGTQQTAARIAEARADLAMNTAVRGVNTAVGSTATLLAGPASPVAAAIAALANVIGDAYLRNAHNASMSGLERSNGDLTQRAQEVIRNARNRSPTNTLAAPPGSIEQSRVDDGARCEPPTNADPGAGQALIVVNQTYDGGRTITFRSTVRLTNAISVPGLPAYVDRDFRGKGTGPY